MKKQSYAIRQFQTKLHKITNFQDLKSVLQDQNLRAYFHMSTVGYESVRLDLLNGTFNNLDRVAVEVAIMDSNKMLLQDSLQVDAYPHECSFSDLEYLWLRDLKRILKM